MQDIMSDTASEVSSIVIDNGSYTCKGGFSGDDAPRSIFPSIVGTPRYDPQVVGSQYKDPYVGDEAVVRKPLLSLSKKPQDPDGIDWDDMEKVWWHLFYNELRVDPKEYGVLITDKPFRSKGYREKMVEIMFEKFGVQSFYTDLEAVFYLYGSGRQSGTVFESGFTTSYAVPVYDGHTLSDAIKGLNVAGKHLTDYLCEILQTRGYSYWSTSERKIVNEMKERMGFCAMDFDSELVTGEKSDKNDKRYELPDGKSIYLRNETIRCVEPMFKPSLINKDHQDGIHKVVYDAIMECGRDIQKEMFENIVLGGASTMFPNFSKRLKKEISCLVSSCYNVNIVAPPERKLKAWIGGSIFASLPSMSTEWITKQEYEEYGSEIVHKKCS